MLMSLATKIISFNKTLAFSGKLPDGIAIMNPFRDDERIMEVSSLFYRKYYSDDKPRHLILGINPGRFGAGVTGIPFTDTKRLASDCGIAYHGRETHEPSSVFVYEMIKAYGGPAKFYSDFYIAAVCPLGFTITDAKGRVKNYNYYDSAELTLAVTDFIVSNIKTQISLGVMTDICYCLGAGKNERFLRSLNEKHGFFMRIIALEHPRFIMQYRSAKKDEYVRKYLAAFSLATGNSGK